MQRVVLPDAGGVGEARGGSPVCQIEKTLCK